MNDNKRLMNDWEYSVLGIYNARMKGSLHEYFNLIRNMPNEIKGDICEVGVYKGSSILATALLLKEIGSDRRVWGFDGFSGFPFYHEFDSLDMFEMLYRNGKIKQIHYDQFKLNIKYKRLFSRCEYDTASTISTSGNFSDASIELLREKIDFLGLDNIVLVDGDFSNTMSKDVFNDVSFCSVLMDCDLYQSHKIALPFVWERMGEGACMFLDEYYSLKFPGARIAIDEFFEEQKDKPEMYQERQFDFERWFVRKTIS